MGTIFRARSMCSSVTLDSPTKRIFPSGCSPASVSTDAWKGTTCSRLQPRRQLLDDLVAEECNPLRDQARRRIHEVKGRALRRVPRQDATELGGVVAAGA